MEYIRTRYGVPAKRGGKVIYRGGGLPRTGTIVGASRGNAHLRIRLDGDAQIGDFHPTWELEYLDKPKPKTSVHNLVEGGFVVRGETDPFKALLLIMDDKECSWPIDEVIEGLAPGHMIPMYDWPKHEPTGYRTPSPEEIEAWTATAAHYFARLLDPQNIRSGWMRISPCGGNCGEHSWHWGTATGPGRGNFEGVVFE